MTYIYGPMRSRRLGASLGVSITPYKICNFDCVYCQLGKTPQHTVARGVYVPVQEVLAELKEWLATHPKQATGLAHITFSGTGEPTLHEGIGELIRGIKQISGVPVAVLTNAGLLDHAEVRSQLLEADILIPSLDAARQGPFERVDRPAVGIRVDAIIEGLVALRQEYRGQLWLEVMLVKGVNDHDDDLAALREAIARIKPDKVQLNSPVRVTAEAAVCAVDRATLERAQKLLGVACEIV